MLGRNTRRQIKRQKTKAQKPKSKVTTECRIRHRRNTVLPEQSKDTRNFHFSVRGRVGHSRVLRNNGSTKLPGLSGKPEWTSVLSDWNALRLKWVFEKLSEVAQQETANPPMLPRPDQTFPPILLNVQSGPTTTQFLSPRIWKHLILKRLKNDVIKKLREKFSGPLSSCYKSFPQSWKRNFGGGHEAWTCNTKGLGETRKCSWAPSRLDRSWSRLRDMAYKDLLADSLNQHSTRLLQRSPKLC